MKLINRENGEELVEVGSHKDYASKGVAGAGLGLGIAGTALWLLSGGLGGGLFGNRFGAAGAAALGAESTVEKEDKCELVNGMWQLAFNGQTARFNDRNQINAEMFGIYKSQVDADFGLYKSTRDSFDITNARVGELEKQVAVLIATRPYQDALIQSDIRRVLVEFLDIKLTNLSKDNQLVNVFIRPIFSRIINNNIGKVNQALSIIADENGMIDADGILNDMIDNLIISPVKEERGIKIGAGNVEIKIPFINKAIALDKDDINEFKEMLSKIQQ